MLTPRFRSVILDCDSTLCAIEGIDELAGPHREEVERLTAAAMRGELPLEAVYGRRLELIAPTRQQVEALGRQYLATLVDDAFETIERLRRGGVQVRIISGGLRPPVMEVAKALDVPADRVAAVDIFFDSDGRYAGYDEDSPLARSGGKTDVLAGWRADMPGPTMLVGDGITDAEARESVDSFVAFAGVVERPAVVARADAIIREPSLRPLLPLVFGDGLPPDLRSP